MYNAVERVKINLELSSQYKLTPPVIEIKNNNQTVYPCTEISGQRNIEFNLFLPNDRVQVIQFEIHRSNFDGENEQILNLDRFYLDGINLNKICHHSKYYPVYPEPWITEQRDSGVNWSEYLTGVTSLGWNGTWVLEYETPIYTWLLKNV